MSEKLLMLIDKRDRKQAQLVRATGMGQSALSDVCNGKRLLKLSEAVSLARALDVTVEYLADETLVDPDHAPRLTEDERAALSLYRDIRGSVGATDALKALTRLAAARPGEQWLPLSAAGPGGSVERPDDQGDRPPRRTGKR